MTKRNCPYVQDRKEDRSVPVAPDNNHVEIFSVIDQLMWIFTNKTHRSYFSSQETNIDEGKTHMRDNRLYQSTENDTVFHFLKFCSKIVAP